LTRINADIQKAKPDDLKINIDFERTVAKDLRSLDLFEFLQIRVYPRNPRLVS